MNKEVAVKQMGIPQTLDDSIKIGKLFFESGLFQDVKSAAQAVVKIQAGAEIGITPFQAISNFHIIKGKPTVGAHLMAAKIKASGKYDYEVVKHDDTICHIDFYMAKNGERGQKIGESIMTIQDATKLGSQNLQKMPRNMLFARAISNGQRWHCPDVFTGVVYVPEEMNDIQTTHDTTYTDVTQQQALPQTTVDVLDPNNPEHVEKWNGLLALFQDKSLPAKWTTHKGAEFDKKATGMAMYEEFQAGSLTIAKADKTVEYLKQVIEHFKSQHKTEETDG